MTRFSEYDEIVRECDELEARRRELLALHDRSFCTNLGDEDWYGELEANEAMQALLILVIGAYEVLMSDS